MWKREHATILRDEGPTAESTVHYKIREKNYFLGELGQKVRTEGQLQQVDRRSNMRISHYMSKLAALQQQAQSERDCYLHSSEFQTIIPIS